MEGKQHISPKSLGVILGLMLLLLLCPPSKCAKRRWRRTPHLKLGEKYNDYEYPLLSYQKNDRCPPPPQTLPDRVRSAQLPLRLRVREAQALLLQWLHLCLLGVGATTSAEACSTTEDGDEPLHCPTGYECHIINPGNAAEGIPNRGQCIKLRGNSDGWNLRPKHYKEYFGDSSNNMVGYVKQQQKHLG